MAQNMVLLDRVELNDSASSVTFNSIPQTGYTDLVVKLSARTNHSDVADFVKMRFNSSTTSYSLKAAYGISGSAASQSFTDLLASVDGNNATSSTFGNGEYYIPNYAGSTYKSVSIDSVGESNAANGSYAWLGAGLWSDTTAISTIALLPFNGTAFLAGSTFSLYGIAAYGTTPAIAPKADGGNVIATDGTYWYHAFLSSGTFTPQTNLTADILQIAGGGGASGAGGGGGAGGLLYYSAQGLTATSYTCTVGAGGAAGGSGVNATNGNNSQFASLTASVGGGFGGGYYGGASYSNAGNGGSGGGASYYTGTTNGTGTTGQGYDGAYGYQGTGGGDPRSGGGGGGAAAVGGTGSANVGGNGGAGVSTYSSWGLATVTGQNVGGTVYYAGGGGGASNGTPGTGGNGGGGNGAITGGYAGAGLPNTGGGAGSAHDWNISAAVKGGGSGIIIIRYPIAS